MRDVSPLTGTESLFIYLVNSIFVEFPEWVAVYVDESGDLGFSKKALKRSPIFVIAYLVPRKPLRLANDLKKFLKKIKFKAPELKFHEDREETRKAVLEFLNKHCKFEAGYIAISKTAVREELRRDPSRLYNYLAIHFVISQLVRTYSPSKIIYIIDKSMRKSRMLEFNEYAVKKARWMTIRLAKAKDIALQPNEFVDIPEVEVRHEDSRNDVCVQIADYLAGSIGHAFRGDLKYYNVIAKKFKSQWKITLGLEKL